MVVGEDSPQRRIVEMTLVDEHPDELPLDKLVTPLPTGTDALGKKCRDRGLKARIVGPKPTLVSPSRKLTRRGCGKHQCQIGFPIFCGHKRHEINVRHIRRAAPDRLKSIWHSEEVHNA